MIVRSHHPQDPGDRARHVYIPLAHDRQNSLWIPLGQSEDGFCVAAIDAVQVCVSYFHRAWDDIEQQARTLRALCEHPNFIGLVGDGIDAKIISDCARKLAERIELATLDVANLASEPSTTDVIELDGRLFQVDESAGLLVPVVVEQAADDADSPDGRFLQLVEASRGIVQKVTRQAVTREGIANAIRVLERWLEEREPTANDDGLVIERMGDETTARYPGGNGVRGHDGGKSDDSDDGGNHDGGAA